MSVKTALSSLAVLSALAGFSMLGGPAAAHAEAPSGLCTPGSFALDPDDDTMLYRCDIGMWMGSKCPDNEYAMEMTPTEFHCMARPDEKQEKATTQR
ncbi:hypothetical protein JK358_36055 [Nocardia sp. 2]|uniref:Chitin-binding type-2 domain-containing protein n=1 Tax=Nocardia acididurans TaxID=2802282 RepID=A0ABS1MGN7_9NOCA|nr:hypothetical protein [Nocardia acididurans]MBL1079831.1 hypothetical protein [Nocardia acididurans]